jgi:hypothetical protein
MGQRMKKPLQLFCCYAHNDQKYLYKLKNHLMALQRENLIEVKADIDIQPGAEWEREIDHHLENAQIILLLISAEFLASNYCYEKEMQQALRRHEQGTARVVPVIIRPSSWQGTPLRKLQVLPKGAKPVSSWENVDEALLDISEGIRRIIEPMAANSSANLSTDPYDPWREEGSDLDGVRNNSLILPTKKYSKIGSQPKIFISHSKRNHRRAEQLASLLLLNNIQVWFDDWEMLVGHNIYNQVYSGILSSDYLAVLITRASLQSRWVNEELNLARQRELETNQVVILPLLFEKVELPLHLRTKHYADFTNFEKGFRDLMNLLQGDSRASLVEDKVLQAVRESIAVKGATEMIAQTHAVTSFANSRLVSQTTLRAQETEDILRNEEANEKTQTVVILLGLQSANKTISIHVDLKNSVKHVLARIVRALGLPNALDGNRVSYFLLYEGYPLELNESLDSAGIEEGSLLQLGAYTYAIE